MAICCTGCLQGGYDLVRYNVTRLCEAYITPACIQQQGADACMYEHIQSVQRLQAQQQREQLQHTAGCPGACSR
jgi:hypothetical protein